jgi:hypothetical protein
MLVGWVLGSGVWQSEVSATVSGRRGGAGVVPGSEVTLTGSEADRGARVTGSRGWQRVRGTERLRSGRATVRAETLS